MRYSEMLKSIEEFNKAKQKKAQNDATIKNYWNDRFKELGFKVDDYRDYEKDYCMYQLNDFRYRVKIDLRLDTKYEIILMHKRIDNLEEYTLLKLTLDSYFKEHNATDTTK